MAVSPFHVEPMLTHTHIHTIVAKCPGLAGTVPVFGPMSRLCPGLPDFAALSRNPAQLHKWRCGTSINSVYYRMSARISRCLVGVAIHYRPKVGVVNKFFARINSILYDVPGLSSHKLGNYDIHTYIHVHTFVHASLIALSSYGCQLKLPNQNQKIPHCTTVSTVFTEYFDRVQAQLETLASMDDLLSG